MLHRFLFCVFLFSMVANAQPEQHYYSAPDESWSWGYGSEEGGGGSSYLGVDIADVSPERLGELKLKEEHGAEITMVDGDAPAGKAGLREHDVIVSLNGTAVESTAQLRRMIKETPPGRVITLGISRDGQPVTVKVQLADRHKSMSWEPGSKMEIPAIPAIPKMPEFDMPVSVVVVHQSERTGLMVENITPQLGEFFGVKDGKGVLIRSVDKGGRGEKAGFRAGDVVVKVNNQPVRDSSDFTHALHSASGGAASVTVMRDKREQTLSLPLPEKKDSGNLLEESFDDSDFTAEIEEAVGQADAEIAVLAPAINERVRLQTQCSKEIEEQVRERQEELQERQREAQEDLQEKQQELRDRQEETQEEMKDQQEEIKQEIQERQQEVQQDMQEQQELRLEFSGGLAEI